MIGMTTPHPTPVGATGASASGSVGRWIEFLTRWRYGLIALVALAQAGVLAHMVWDRETLIRTGRQIDLAVIPVDPRSLFRGDYVVLGYEISQVPRTLIAGKVRRGEQVFVRLTQDNGVWKPRSVSRDYPADQTALNDDVVMAARVMYAPLEEADETDGDEPDPPNSAARVRLRYGIESFFVPEGTGSEIERDVGAKKVVAHVVVDNRGRAAIRALSVDGVRIEALPLL